jgi:ketopantoate hydroxymethyltransferase
LDREILKALAKFRKAVKQGTFPSAAESYAMDPEQARLFKRALRGRR